MSGDLVTFLRARLDEDARVARAATPGPWRASEYYPDAWEIYGPTHCIANEGRDGDIGRGDAEHIARHDPARVLREVAAKRAIVDEHALLDPPLDPDDLDWPLVCARCEDRRRHDAMRWPCPTLRLLAAAYADHPGYREEWRP